MNIIITGAGKGIGLQLVREFAGVKCDILALSRNTARLTELTAECKNLNLPASINIISADVRLPETINLKFQHIDVLINNAGFLKNLPFEQMDEVSETEMLNTNFLAPARLIRQWLPHMGGSQPTHIVNIGSMGGFQGSAKFPGMSMYSASKAALACLTECLATEFTGRNIFVNCLALGAVDTEMLQQAFRGYKAPVGPTEMAAFIADFARTGYKQFNGKILPVSVSTP